MGCIKELKAFTPRNEELSGFYDILLCLRPMGRTKTSLLPSLDY